MVDDRLRGSPLDPSSKGDRADFEAFYAANHDLQVRRAFVLVRSNEHAIDIVHDAMVGVWRRWRDLDNPAAYLSRSVLNGCRDAARRRTARDAAIRRLRPAGDDRPEPEIFDDLLEALPFNHRAAVVLRYYAGLTTAEIAAALGCPQNSVGPWITRALTALRKELT